MSATTTRVRGLASWEPRAATLTLLDTVRGVLAEYTAYLPMTLRQIFYRLVGAHDYPKDERAYDQLGEMLNRARRGGHISFHDIRDDGADIRVKLGYDSAADLIATWRYEAETFRLDRQLGQPHRLLVVVEAAGMAPMVADLTADHSIPVVASGGFDSTTAKHRLAVALGEYDGLTEILHIGDHDPSGTHMFTAILEDVEQFIADLGLPGEVLFTRLAVTPEQVVTLGLPTAPPKPSDRRSFEGETTQAEALPPDVLAQIIAGAIEERRDHAAYAAVLEREAGERGRLLMTLDRLLEDDQ